MARLTRNPIMETFRIISVIVDAFLAIGALTLLIRGGGDLRRIGTGFRILWRCLGDSRFTEQMEALLKPPSTAQQPAKPSGAPLRLLSVLQREGRLVDFLLEDIQAYPDAQIGAAVRDIHRQCQAALKEHLALAPVVTQAEGDTMEVPPGFDPSSIRLTGNVAGEPPFRGALRHHGWRVLEIKLAPPPPGQDEFVLMPAEVEVA
jgi:Domain of unknown function (DUF2760)